jgi:Uncharacterized ACR, COG1753.
VKQSKRHTIVVDDTTYKQLVKYAKYGQSMSDTISKLIAKYEQSKKK